MCKYVIGIDESYTRTGITVLKDKEIYEIHSLDFRGLKTNSEKRGAVICYLAEIMEELSGRDVTVIVERIRLFSQGKLSQNYLTATGALIGCMIDYFATFGMPVYSVDTRAWKSAVVGNSRPMENPYGIDPHKYPTILYLRRKGILRLFVEEYQGRGEKGILRVNMDGRKARVKVNDDLCDSYCIAMYGFLPKRKQKLKEETF